MCHLVLFKYTLHYFSQIIYIIIVKYSYHKLDAYKVVDYYSEHFWVIKWLCYPSWQLVS